MTVVVCILQKQYLWGEISCMLRIRINTFLLGALLLTGVKCFAQDAGNLLTQSVTAPDREKYDVFFRLQNLFMGHDKTTAHKYATRMLETARTLNDPALIAFANYTCANISYALNRYPDVLKHCDEALAYYQINGPDTMLGHVHYTYSLVFLSQNYLTRATESLLLALQSYRRSNHPDGIGTVYYQLSQVFVKTGDFSRTRFFLTECIRVSESAYQKGQARRDLARLYFRNDSIAQARRILSRQVSDNSKLGKSIETIRDYMLLGDFYWEIGQPDSSRGAYQHALDLSSVTHQNQLIGTILTKFAHIHSEKGEWQKTLEYNLMALKAREIAGELKLMASSWINIGGNYMHLNDYTEAERAILKGLQLAFETGSHHEINQAYSKLSECYTLFNQVDKLFRNNKRQARFNDSLNNLNNAQAANLLFSYYESDEARQNILREARHTARLTQVISYSFAGIIVVLVIVLILHRYQLKRIKIRTLLSENNVIRNQKQQLEEALAELRKTSLRFKAFTESTLSGIGIVDDRENFVYANPALCALLKYSHEELIGTNLVQITAGPEFNRFIHLTGNRRSGLSESYETTLLQKDGQAVQVIVSAAPILDEKGQFYGTLGIITDITEKRRLMEELEAAKVRAEESDRLKSAFLSNMSHEMRTPLNAIMGGVMLLYQDGVSEDERKEIQQQVSHHTYNLLETWDNIIILSRIQARVFPVNKKWVKLKKLVHDTAMETIMSLPPEKAGKVDLLVDENGITEDLELYTDEEITRKILRCLLSNAAKFTEAGSINIRFSHENDDCILTVSDTGKGMTEREISYVFDPFRQGDEGMTRRFGGSGLGLAVVRSLSALLNGQIRIQSKPGEGTSISVLIPCAVTHDKSKSPQFPSGKNTGLHDWSDKTILVAEDVDSNYILLEAILKKHKARVIRALDGRQAVESVRQYPEIDLVMMDIQMPVLNGLEATRQIREFNPEVVIIALTAYAMIHDRQKTLLSGCNDYLTKPFRMQKLLEVLSRYLNQN